MTREFNPPAALVRNVRQAFGSAGEQWADRLPALLQETARRWNLALGEPFPLSYNYVCAANRSDGTPAVLKIGVPNDELSSEIHALCLYDGRGACRVLEADPTTGALLLERLVPGMMLSTLDDDQATEIAAELMRRLWRSPPVESGFLSLRGWFAGLAGLRARFGGTTGPFAERTVAVVEGLLGDLLAEDRPQVLLHGDFHHANVLLSSRGWLAIDPKGVVGPAEYEVGPLLINPWGEPPAETEAIRRTQRRIAILSDRLGFDRERLRAWAICHAVLSAWWDLAEDGTGGEHSRAWAEIFAGTRV
jgi:streptomycin 6-kinase